MPPVGGLVGIVVEGVVDRRAVQRILASRSLTADPARTIDTRGTGTFDARLATYNAAARHGAWLALRDSDTDGDDCPATLRRSLLSVPQNSGLCLRLAVRTIEAWFLADADAFAEHFAVPLARIPAAPEDLLRPEVELAQLCRSSRRRDIRVGVAAPPGSKDPGPEYTSVITDFCASAWRPDVAAGAAPSPARALREIDHCLASGRW